MLLEVDPQAVEAALDRMVWQSDLSEPALEAGRWVLGLPNPVTSPLNTPSRTQGPDRLAKHLADFEPVIVRTRSGKDPLEVLRDRRES